MIRIRPVRGVRGGHFRLALAAATLLFALGAALLARDGGNQAVRASVGDAPVGTAVKAPGNSGRSLAFNTQVSRPSVVGPLRNLRPSKPVWHGNKNVEERELTYPLRAAPGESYDGALQSSMPGPKVPGPPTTFEGVNNMQRRLPAGHERRRRAEPLHAVGQPLLRGLQQDHGARSSSGPPPATRSSTSTPICARAERRRPGRALRPVRRSLARRAVHRTPTSLYRASRSRRRTTRPGTWCAVRVSW